MTFEDFIPFLKGFYLTLNSWRPGRDREGWKVSNKEWVRVLTHQFESDQITHEELEFGLHGAGDKEAAPALVRAACPWHKNDVLALSVLLGPSLPPVIPLRSRSIVTVVYGFGDASGSGLGSTFTCGSGFTYRIRVWGADDYSQTSNWKEFCNIVTSLEDEAEEGNLSQLEVFMFTDNSTVESCCGRGTSSSQSCLTWSSNSGP